MIESAQTKGVAASMTETSTGRLQRSFEAFYAEQLSRVVGLAFVLSGSRTAAEELAQEGFLTAFIHWDRVRGLDDPGAWVSRVVANRAMSRFRRLRSEVRALTRLERAGFVVPDGDPDADALWRRVRALPKRQAQTIALHYLDDRRVEEIAEILNISIPTVKTHLQRAREALARDPGLEAP